MKKIVTMVLTIMMLMTFVPYVNAAEIIANGECGSQGDNVKWSLDEEGVLTISGNGKMADFDELYNLPYKDLQGKVTAIVIEDGVTYIGNNAFCWAFANLNNEMNIRTITIPKTIKGLGYCAFAYVKNVDTVYYNAEDCTFMGDRTGFANNYFPMGKKLVIGRDVKNIGANVFLKANGFSWDQNTYTSVQYEGSEEEWKNVTVDYEGNNVLELITFGANSKAEKPIRILLNNRFVETDQDPLLIEDRTMVPLRVIAEALDADVKWNDSEKSITVVKNEKEVYLQIGSNVIIIDGKSVELDVPAEIVNDRAMLPIRAITEAFDCMVSWNGYQKYVVITSNGQKPYKIDAVDGNGEIVATAHFNECGQLTDIENTSVWFMPLLANINGNCYMDLFSSCPNNVSVEYDGNNISKISSKEKWGDRNYTYTYNSDGTISDSGRIYGENKIYYPKYFGSDLLVTLSLDERGLVSEYDKSESGGSGSLTYDDKGNLTHWTSYFGVDYDYDDQNRLKRSVRKYVGDYSGEVITYCYTEK